jgi:hypothetical protein
MGLMPPPGSLDMDSFRGALDDSDVLDLRSCTFVDAYALVGFACVAESLAASGRRPAFHAPDVDEVRNYLSRMHLQETLKASEASIVGSPLPVVKEHAGPDRLLALRTFRSGVEYEQLANLVWERLEGHVGPEVLGALYETLQEVGANVIEHSQATRGGYIAAQVYRRNTPDEYVLLAIGDCGVGIRHSLSTRYPIASDEEALRLALSSDVSASGEPGRGQGLPSTAKLVTSLLGRVVVHSGGATVTCRQERTIVMATSRIEGTLVGARIPCRPGKETTR